MTLSEEFEIRIATYEEVEGYMTDEALGAVFRNLIHEMAEKRRTVSERQRKNVKKRYQKATTSLPNTYQTPTNQLPDNLPDDATPLPPTPPISDNKYINIYNTDFDVSTDTQNQSFDTSTGTELDTSGTSPCTSSNKFQKPTLEEVKSYVAEKGYSVNPEKFFAYYEAGGWMVGKRPMKSWRMALTYWHNNGIDRSQHPPNNQSKRVAEQNYTQREYTDEQLDSLIADI